MDIEYVKGERILLTDNCSQTFVGVVKSVNTDLGRISLTDVIQFPGNKSIKGYRNFDKDEIVDIKKCEPLKSVDNKDNLQKQSDKHPLKMPEVEYNEIKRLQSEYRFIRDCGTNFHEAVSLLRSCKTIGVYGKDVSKGRFGRASVLAISSPSNVFVFDVQVLGDDAMRKGLKEILESESVTKVVHDCRLLSDCLRHKHLINLENVRDVEAEDIMVVFQERRIVRKHSRSLEYLLKVYLGVEVDGRDGNSDDWNERPLPPRLLDTLVCFASFLVPLQEAIERKYLGMLIDASNVYNNHVRGSDFVELLYEDPKKTLRKEMSELLTPRSHIRSAYRPNPR